MSSGGPRDEVQMLLIALTEREISDEQFERLETLITDDPAARRAYHEQLQAHCMLLFNHRPEPAETPAGALDLVEYVQQASEQLRQGRRTPPVSTQFLGRFGDTLGFRSVRTSSVAMTLLIAAVVYGSFGLAVWHMGQYEIIVSAHRRPLAVGPAAIEPHDFSDERAHVAILVGDDNCVWRQGRQFRLGQKLNAHESLELVSGTARVEFTNGAEMTIPGPARFTVKFPDGGRLDEGRVAVSVPPRAIGFALDTPTARVVDLGTRFGVEVSAGGVTEVLVLQGRVDVVPVFGGAQPTRMRLTADQGLRIDRIRVTRFSGVDDVRFGVLLGSATVQRHSASPMENPSYTAYQVPAGIGGEQGTNTNMSGMDFVVRKPIEITHLGVFDHHSNGLQSTLTVMLWSRNDLGTRIKPSDDVEGELLATEIFTPEDAGQLEGGSRFKSLVKPLVLLPGAYTVGASGFGPDEPSGNRSRDVPWTMNDGHGLIEFVGTGRDGAPGRFMYSMNLAEVPNPFAAGTFKFRRAANHKP